MKKTKNEKAERAEYIVEKLKEIYPEAICTLESEKPWMLLEMTRLAAQCTDARVNIVSKELFEKYPTPKDMAEADVEELEKIIYSCGFYHGKARDLIKSSEIIHNKYNDNVPDTMEELLELPGVGRKIANLILGDVYHKPAIVTDTHCIRISNRMGLSDSKVPYETEKQLKKIVKEEEQSDFCHRLVMFGRDTCTARNPKCENCPFKDLNCKL